MGASHHETNKDPSPGGSNKKSKIYKEQTQYSYELIFLAVIACTNGVLHHKTNKDPCPGSSNKASKKNRNKSDKAIIVISFSFRCLYEWVCRTKKQNMTPFLGVATPSQMMDKEQVQYSCYCEFVLAVITYVNG